MSKKSITLLGGLAFLSLSYSQTFKRNYSLFDQPFIYQLAFTPEENTLNGKFILYQTKMVTDTTFIDSEKKQIGKSALLDRGYFVAIKKEEGWLNFFKTTESLKESDYDLVKNLIDDSVLLVKKKSDTAKKNRVDTIVYVKREVEDNTERNFQLYDPLSKEHFKALAKSHLSKIITNYPDSLAKNHGQLDQLINELYEFSIRKLGEAPVASLYRDLEAKSKISAGTISVPSKLKGYKVCYFPNTPDQKYGRKFLRPNKDSELEVYNPLGHIDYLVLNSSFTIFENQIYARLTLAREDNPDSTFPVNTRLPFNLAARRKEMEENYISIYYDNYDAVEANRTTVADSADACRIIFWLTDVFTYSHDTLTGAFSPYVIDTVFAMHGGNTVTLHKRGINNYISLIAFSDILGLNSDIPNDYLLTEVEFNFPLKQRIRHEYNYKNIMFGTWHMLPGVQGSMSASLINGNKPALQMKEDTLTNQFYVNQLDLIRQRTYEGAFGLPIFYHRTNRFFSVDFIPGLRLYGTYLEKFKGIDSLNIPQFDRGIVWSIAPQLNLRIRVNPDDWWGFDLNMAAMYLGVQHGIKVSYENVNQFEKNQPPKYDKSGQKWYGVFEFNAYFLRSKLSDRTDGLFGRLRFYDNFGNRNFYPMFLIGYSSSLGKRIKNY